MEWSGEGGEGGEGKGWWIRPEREEEGRRREGNQDKACSPACVLCIAFSRLSLGQERE